MKILATQMQGCARIIGLDLTIASALTYRGHEVSFMGCGLALPACDCSDMTVMPKFGHSCMDRRPIEVGRNVGINLPVLRRYLEPGDLERAVQWVGENAPSIEAGMAATYDDLPVGHMAHQSWRNFWRSIKPRLMSEPEPSFFSFLVSTRMLVDLWERALDEIKPDLVWTLNGLYPRQRIPCELVKRRGGRFVTYDVMGPLFHIHHNEGAPYLHQDEAWDTVNPTEAELEAAKAAIELEGQKPGASFGEDYLAGQTSETDWEAIKAEAGIDDRPILAWFPNVAYDSGVVGFEGSEYRDLPDVIDATVDWCGRNHKYQLVLRMHPNERNDPAMTLKGEALTAYLAQTHPNLPENIKVIPAESNANSIVIAKHSKAAVVWTSSLAWQLAYEQVPVIVAGWAACSKRVGYAAHTAADYWRLVNDAMDDGLRPQETWKQEALTYKAVVEGRCWIDLNHLIGKGGVNDFVPQWQGGWAALKPGFDARLDMICECIEDGRPFYWPR